MLYVLFCALSMPAGLILRRLDAVSLILALQTGFGVSWEALLYFLVFTLKTEVPVDSRVPKQKSQVWTVNV